jgi:hypothetical protein
LTCGNVYVSDGNSFLEHHKFTPNGVGSVFAYAGGEGNWGLAFGSAGDLYYTSHFTDSISKLSPDGVELGGFGAPSGSNLNFLALTDDNGVPVPLANQRTAPEPTTWALLGLGLPALVGFSRPRRLNQR